MTDRLVERRGMNTTVYEPAEDSALLADAVCDRVEADDLVLDLGTGSGYVGGEIRERTGARVVAADVNPHACRRAAALDLPTCRADLVSAFATSSVDVVAFNPPYLPTAPTEERDDWMERALSGGKTGRRVIDPFLDRVGRVLVEDGRVYLLVSSLTGVESVVRRAGQNGFSAVALADESFPFETLTVLELRR